MGQWTLTTASFINDNLYMKYSNSYLCGECSKRHLRTDSIGMTTRGAINYPVFTGLTWDNGL
jgi:hypothetical protein